MAFGTQKTLVMRDLKDPLKTRLYGEGIEGNVSCVRYSPSGYYIAFGDD
jgi:hypothetical protein